MRRGVPGTWSAEGMETPNHGIPMETHSGAAARLTAFGNQLVDVHLWLRGELAELRENVESYLDGRGERPRHLQANCLSFCSALSRHHTGEDSGAFPVLIRQFPELRPVIDNLRQDHELVADILRRLTALVEGIGPDLSPSEIRRMRAELDGLTAILESHFVYEERRLVTVLNGLRIADGTADASNVARALVRHPRR